MVVTINGERQEVASTTIQALLAELGYEGGFFAVAVNEELVRRPSWPASNLSNGDRIEILTPRQGG